MALSGLRRFQEAIEAVRRAVAIYREAGDRHGEAVSLVNLGNALRRTRRFQEAITILEQAVEIRRELDDQQGEAAALITQGIAELPAKLN